MASGCLQMFKRGTLSFQWQGVAIRDLQLWQGEGPSGGDRMGGTEKHVECKYMCYVELEKLPMWAYGELYHCYTSSSTSLRFVQSKLKWVGRGILLRQLNKTGGTGNATLYCLTVVNAKELSASTGLQQEPQSDDDKAVVCITLRTNEHITQYIKDQKLKQKRQLIQLDETITRLILNGLRLRDVPSDHPDYTKIYKMTFNATKFAIRTYKEGLPPVVQLQETVETLLTLFVP